MSDSEREEQRRATRAAVLLTILALAVLALLGWGIAQASPTALSWIDQTFTPGLGLKAGAVIAAIVSFLLLILFAIVAGDGLIGEIQFMILGFFMFFFFFWIMTAWVF